MTKCVPFTFRNEKAFTLWMNRLPRKPVCDACGKEFTSKDTVKPRRLNSKYGAHTVHYHVGCYEAGMESVSVKDERQRLNLALLDLFDRIHVLEKRVKK
jgi:hypothetical protein